MLYTISAILIAVLFFSGKAIADASAPKGFRNNNPGNLEYNKNINWLGQIGSDGRYAKFDTMKNGVRANYINLRTSYHKYGNDTILDIIKRWAPADENPTIVYAKFVGEKSGLGLSTPFQFDKNNAIKILDGIFHFENGRPLDINLIREGVEAAGD